MAVFRGVPADSGIALTYIKSWNMININDICQTYAKAINLLLITISAIFLQEKE